MNEREKLLAEAEALKAQREALASEHAARKAAYDAQQRSDATSTTQRKLRASLGRFTLPAFITLLTAALITWLSEHDADDAHPPDLFVPRMALLALSGLVMVWRFSGPMRHRRWLASLPFPVLGLTEALSGGQAVIGASVGVTFDDTVAPIEVVRELVQAKVPTIADRDPMVVTAHERGFNVTVEFFPESSNYPLAGWFPVLAERVLRKVHAGFPIARVTVSPTKVDEFYVPSGD